MIEKQLLNVLEPVLCAIEDLRGQVEDVAKKEAAKGEPGKDADPCDVALALVTHHLDEIRGPKGDEPESFEVDIEDVASELIRSKDFIEMVKGKDAEPTDPESVALILMQKYSQLLVGPAGETPEICVDDVAETLLQQKDFTDLVKGEQGEPGLPGKDADAGEVAEKLYENYGHALKAEKPTVDYGQLSEFLRGSKEFVTLVKGETGEQGCQGKDADPQTVAEIIVGKYADKLRGENGKDAEPVDYNSLAEVIKKDEPFLKSIKGKDGNHGLGVNIQCWENGIYRKDSVVQHHFGQYYQAGIDTNSEPGKSTDWERIGTGGFRWTGLKQKDRKYENGDLFIENGTTFIVWDGKASIFAKRGKNGEHGKPGEKGDRGEDAAHIVAMEMGVDRISAAFSNGEVMDAEVKGVKDYVANTVEAALEAERDYSESKLLDLGTPFTVFRGKWQSGKKYSVGDGVIRQGSLRLCKSANNGTTFNDGDWEKLPVSAAGKSAPAPSAAIRSNLKHKIVKDSDSISIDLPKHKYQKVTAKFTAFVTESALEPHILFAVSNGNPVLWDIGCYSQTGNISACYPAGRIITNRFLPDKRIDGLPLNRSCGNEELLEFDVIIHFFDSATTIETISVAPQSKGEALEIKTRSIYLPWEKRFDSIGISSNRANHSFIEGIIEWS